LYVLLKCVAIKMASCVNALAGLTAVGVEGLIGVGHSTADLLQGCVDLRFIDGSAALAPHIGPYCLPGGMIILLCWGGYHHHQESVEWT
jgi:hypothetical protein